MQICTGFKTSSDKKFGHIHEEIVVADGLHCPLCEALEENERLETQIDRLQAALEIPEHETH